MSVKPNRQARPCAAIRRDGQPCAGEALPESELCFSHHPSLAEKRLAGRRRGGVNSSAAHRAARLLPARLGPVVETLETAIADLRGGKLEPRTATALASLARALVATVQAGEMEERMRNLEAILGERPEASI